MRSGGVGWRHGFLVIWLHVILGPTMYESHGASSLCMYVHLGLRM
jgi:hypothetical protein